MKHNHTTLLLLALLALLRLVTGSLMAADPVPAVISYQGRLIDAAGNRLGYPKAVNRKVFFALFDDSEEGERVWTEQQTVTVENGEFNVLLGNGVAVGTLRRESLAKVFSSSGANYYLEVTVDTGNGTLSIANPAEDPPIKPRQRIVTTAFSFRALTTDSIIPNADLGVGSGDGSGLGHFTSARQFGSEDVNGPVLFGADGGGLGSKNGTTESLALSWGASGNVGIGVHPPAERLHVGGNVKASGSITATTVQGITTLSVGGIQGNENSALSLAAASVIAKALTGTSLVIDPGAGPTPATGFTATGGINILSGGTLKGTGTDAKNDENPLNITTHGAVDIGTIIVTDTFTPPPPNAVSFVNVISTERRLVLGGGADWDDSKLSLPPAPPAPPAESTGMRVILAGSNGTGSSSAVGFGLSATDSLFTSIPSTGQMRWFGGVTELLTLSGAGTLTARTVEATKDITVTGTATARLKLTQNDTEQPITQNLALTVQASNKQAQLAWLDKNDNATPILNFKNTNNDPQVVDQVPNKGFVGINVTNPKAYLHVKQYAPYQNNTNITMITTGPSNADGVYLGNTASVVGPGGVGAGWGSNNTIRYEYVAAYFDGEVVTHRNFFGLGLNTSSDTRAKQILGLSDSSQDLETLMRLQVTDYQWIDRSLDGRRPHKRLIAQQVKEVLPQAVITLPMPKAIPNVYELASNLEHNSADGTLTITTKKPHAFKAGNLVDLVADKEEMKETPVKAVLDAHRFVIACTKAPKSLFVYGKLVNDFQTVDYDAISMLNVSATQELKKRRDALATENAKMRAKLKSEAQRIAALDADQKADDAKFTALETLIERAESKATQVKSASLISR